MLSTIGSFTSNNGIGKVDQCLYRYMKDRHNAAHYDKTEQVSSPYSVQADCECCTGLLPVGIYNEIDESHKTVILVGVVRKHCTCK